LSTLDGSHDASLVNLPGTRCGTRDDRIIKRVTLHTHVTAIGTKPLGTLGDGSRAFFTLEFALLFFGALECYIVVVRTPLS
jgi:hypothetical protein